MFDLEERSLCLSILYASFRLLFPTRKCLPLSFGKELSLLLVIGTWNLQDDWLVTGANWTWLEGYCLQRERMTFSEASPGVKGVSQQSIIYFQTWWIGWKCSHANDATNTTFFLKCLAYSFSLLLILLMQDLLSLLLETFSTSYLLDMQLRCH
jgi:hypothetical protein